MQKDTASTGILLTGLRQNSNYSLFVAAATDESKSMHSNTLVLQTGGKRVAPSLPRPHGRTGRCCVCFQIWRTSTNTHVHPIAKHFVMCRLLKRTAVDVVKRLVALGFNCSLFFTCNLHKLCFEAAHVHMFRTFLFRVILHRVTSVLTHSLVAV